MKDRRGPLLVLALIVVCLGALVGLARLDSAASDTPDSKPAAQAPSEPVAQHTAPVPAPALKPTPSAVPYEPPVTEAEPEQLTEWEIEARMDEMAEQGKASMQRTEDAKLEAQFAEACADNPSAPFC